MLRRVLALFATAVLSVTVGLFGAAPAQAAAGGACAQNAICLYQWVDYGAQVSGNRWQSSLQNIYDHPNHCLNLSPATWANGTPVNNNSGSLQWKTNSVWWQYSIIGVYDSANCAGAGLSLGWQVDTVPDQYNYNNLNNLKFYNSSVPLYHNITSIQVL